MFNYAERLKKIMVTNNMSGNRLAGLLGVDQTHISKICNGKALPSFKLINDICQIFDLTLSEFFDESLVETFVRSPLISQEQSLLLKYFNQLNDDNKKIIIFLSKSFTTGSWK